MDVSIPSDYKNLHPLAYLGDDDFAWLDLDKIPSSVSCPFNKYDFELSDNPSSEMAKFMMDPRYLPFTCKHLLNFELLPFQAALLSIMWNYKFPMMICSRGASKSTLLAIYAMLKMCLDQHSKIALVGAAFRQSMQVYGYMNSIWDNAPILRDIAGKRGGPKRDLDRVEMRVGDTSWIGLPLGDGSKIRGIRANVIEVDEFGSISEPIFNVVVQGFGAVSKDPISKAKKEASISKLKSDGKWNDDLEDLVSEDDTGNQIIYSGTAYYSWNHFYKYYKKWCDIIRSQGDKEIIDDIIDNVNPEQKGANYKDYAVVRLPYTLLPAGFLDEGIINQAKATQTTGQFDMEFCAKFSADSNGFFKRSVIESCTTNSPIKIPDFGGVQFSVRRYGDKSLKYVLGIDPAADRDNAALVLIELYGNHRRVVYCWTINKKLFREYKKAGYTEVDNYYYFISNKIREIMSYFNIERIMMDKHGGGTSIAEALRDKQHLSEGEHPIYEIIDPEDQKDEDMLAGIHILDLVKPSTELNSEANHGLLKDMQDQKLLFPVFDTIEIAKNIELDKINNNQFNTYENIAEEVEELKRELETVVCTPTSKLGQEHFDTPEVKNAEGRKGRLRKDRYSALLYANYYARNKDKAGVYVMEYKAVGGHRDSFSTSGPAKNSTKNIIAYSGRGYDRIKSKQKKH